MNKLSISLSFLLGFAAVTGLVPGHAEAEFGKDARDCTLTTKLMSGEVSELSAYLNTPSADRDHAAHLLFSARGALDKARAACRPFPEMTPLLDGLAADVDRIGSAVPAAQAR